MMYTLLTGHSCGRLFAAAEFGRYATCVKVPK
jgi:hypothetical protein